MAPVISKNLIEQYEIIKINITIINTQERLFTIKTNNLALKAVLESEK